jgi:protein involved in polysaccharide export with SLBB domain
VWKEGLWVETPPDDGADWRADTGDALLLEVPGEPELTGVIWVDADGSIWLPKIGEVPVRGLSLSGVNEATQAKLRKLDAPWPGGADAKLSLFEERYCHVIVAGNVLRPLNESVECGTQAARALRRAGVRPADAIDPYVWRAEGGALKRIELDYDRASNATTPALALRGGDIVIVK